MAFTVISFAPGITRDAQARAQHGAPPCTAADAPYTELIEGTGWEVVEAVDATCHFLDTTRRELAAFEARRHRLRELLGEVELAERLALRRARLAALEEGLIRRGLFLARTRAP